MMPEAATATGTAVAPYPVFYSFRRCPYAMRARLALAASRTVCELREVVLAHKPPALLQASPKGTVPVLVLPDGSVLEQSLDIMLWALRNHDPLAWLPCNDTGLQAALHLITECDGPFKRHLDGYKYPQRQPSTPGIDHRSQAADFLRHLDQQITLRGFLHGSNAGLADMAIAPFVRQFAHVDSAWFGLQDWAALRTWLADFEASTLFATTMGKVAAWLPGQPVTWLPTVNPVGPQD